MLTLNLIRLFLASCPNHCALPCRRYVLYIHLVINDMIMLMGAASLQILTYTTPLTFIPCCIILFILFTVNKYVCVHIQENVLTLLFLSCALVRFPRL